MSVDLLKNIAETCPKNTALLGLDVGKKTIGLALSNPDQTLATPLHTIKRTKFTKDMLEIQKVVREYEVGGYVIGLPLHMNEDEGRRAQSVRDFAQEMALRTELFGEDPWITLWDERLSTVSVENIVDNFVEKKSKRRGAKQDGLIDKLAAQLILQGALDFLKAARQSA